MRCLVHAGLQFVTIAYSRTSRPSVTLPRKHHGDARPSRCILGRQLRLCGQPLRLDRAAPRAAESSHNHTWTPVNRSDSRGIEGPHCDEAINARLHMGVV